MPSFKKAAGLLRRYWPLFIPAILLLPHLNQFPYPGSGGQYSDFAITHYPNAVFLQKALSNGTIPLWSPQILSGYPFIAHPFSGIWYPPYWLAMLFPLPLGLNVLVGLHIVWAGIGTYKLVRQSGAGHEASILAGLAFAAAPKVFAHLGAGHLMLLLAVGWTPWLLWSSGRQAGLRLPVALPSAILAFIFCADPRWAIYAGLLWLAWQVNHGQDWRRLLKLLTVAAGLAAPAVLLYLQYAWLSTRGSIASAEVLELSLPLANLLGFLFPNPVIFHEWTTYSGILVLLLAVVARPWKDNARPDRFWLAVLFVSLLISLGSAVPGMQQLASLPGFSQLRIPPRALFLAALALAWLAGFGFQSLLEIRLPTRVVRLSVVGLLGALLMLAGLFFFVLKVDLWRGCILAALLVTFLAVLFELRRAKHLTVRNFAILVIALVSADLITADASLVKFRPAEQVLSEDSAVADFLGQDPDLFRVYSPTYSIAQQTAAARGLQLANGVDPLQLASYAEFMAAASGIPAAGYSVALPPLIGSADPAYANEDSKPDATLLGLLNIKYVASEHSLDTAGLSLVEQVGSTHIYLNQFFRPRAWTENGAMVGEVEKLRWNYNEISVRANGPGLLILSEIYYPGWSVRIDGVPAELTVYREILRSVQLTTGTHNVEFAFFPKPIWLGLLTTAFTILCIRVFASKIETNE